MNIVEKIFNLFSHCFKHFHQTKFLVFSGASFMSAFACYWLFLRIKRSGRRIPFASWLFLNADKSDSNALQVGGIPFSLVSLFSLGLLSYLFPYLIYGDQGRILHYAAYSWLGILFYGYMDDRYEIRPIVKLSSQLLLVSIFCLLASNVVMPENSALAFVIMVAFGTVILNGTNLIDGLDSLSFKISAVIYLGYVTLSAYILCLPALLVATSCFCIMLAFYCFNREPSKIHLGEVGVSCLGFSYIVLSTMVYAEFRKANPAPYAFTKALTPVVLVMVEVGVSFFRRMLTGKSPFRGDRLHVHHILTKTHGFTASNASTIIAASYLVFMVLSFYVMDILKSVASFMLLVILTTGWQFLLGRRHWFRGRFQLNILEALLVKEEVKIIPSNSLSEFRIIINEERDKQ